MQTAQPWYKTWFNSPYYHLLYEHRSEQEAYQFVDQLHSYLKPAPKSRVLDLACGSGRHARHLAAKGYEVWGIDLSPESIKTALASKPSNCFFEVHDMRDVFRKNFFDYVFNFFTSFGYFDSEDDNFKTMHAISENLKKEGFVLIDFLNMHKTMQTIVSKESIHKQGICFQIERKIEQGHIIKNIRFTANGKSYHFEEKLQTLKPEHFKAYFEKSNLLLKAEFGDYQLNPFDINSSDRYIILGQKL